MTKKDHLKLYNYIVMTPGMKPVVKPVEKRGGRRKAIKRKPTNQSINLDYFKETKSKGIFDKKLTQYRFVIYTDFAPEDMLFLTFFTAWVKTNEKLFDSRSNFPIYSIIVGETHDKKTKANMAFDFLQMFAELMSWDDSEHHLYNGYQSACNRIWFDGESDAFEGHTNDDIEEDNANMPEPELFVNHIDEFMQTKATNLFMIYLRPLRFFQTCKDHPELFEHLSKIAGAIYGSYNIGVPLAEKPDIMDLVSKFLNRSSTDAPLIYVTAESLSLLESNLFITSINSPKLFNNLDQYDTNFTDMLKNIMYTWSDDWRYVLTESFRELSIFKNYEFTDAKSFNQLYETLPVESKTRVWNNRAEALSRLLDSQSRQFCITDAMVMISILIASRTMQSDMFEICPCTISITNDGVQTLTKNVRDTNTFAMCFKNAPRNSDDHTKFLRLFTNMMRIALKCFE